MSRADFYASPRFALDSVVYGGRSYGFFVHVPEGLTAEQARGLPLVFSVHGRGEPAWMFAEKNGWDRLADETGAFLLAVPDSPENIWFLERDGGVFARMIDRLHSRYGIDRERVYLTGFTNGGMMTREAGTRYPQLFAALSPWNAPPAETWPGFAEGGWQMPCFIYLGDNDPVARARKNRCWSRCSGQTVVRLCGRPGALCRMRYTTAKTITLPRVGIPRANALAQRSTGTRRAYRAYV